MRTSAEPVRQVVVTGEDFSKMKPAMATDHGFGDLTPLGTGPRATVYAGVRTGTGEAVALKVFRAKLPRRTRTEVERELARLAPLRAQASVLVADALEDLGDRSAVRMELCTQSLTGVVEQEGPLPIAEAVALGRTLALALAAAHEAGIVHGGVTPGNVLYRPSGEPVLADFGVTLRRAFPHEGGAGVDFLAPETLEHGTADERSDLYGLGAVLYLALSGLSPHPARLGEHPDDRKLRVLGSAVPRLDRPGLPDELAELVRALLAKDPAIRPGSMRDVATWLDRLSAPGTPAAGSSGAPPRPLVPRGAPVFVSAPGTTTRKHPALPVIGGAAGLLVVVALGVFLMRTDPAVRGDAPIQAPPTPEKAVLLQLADPVDNVDHVDLRWETEEQLEFFVMVAAEGEKPQPKYAQRNRSLKVEVDPSRKYCFLVQGTDGLRVYESKPKGLRGANCKL
ncbi:Serine/threonine protein kinase [Lentzea xinjiangensis]|uniref:Serine/threonine protein kinase n=1 Tax=Lentzea xinjiangensis TaxID=402600 RepID=A0A1H9J3C2_9PSEU|nr:serine/threonine-protein kinase [Lentzea xinjiangensis]SEQ81380.1 Serine/threonine protein kinase [Lentzea xinjiangensis]